MKKVNKNDGYVRRAIWDIYKHKCFYTNEPLTYKDLELDHIIPESYKYKKDILNKVIEDCGLENNFEINSLYNLVPTSRHENRRKSDNEFSIKSYIYYLEIARKNVSAIEKRIEELKKEKNFDKNVSMIKVNVDEETDKEKRERIIENIFNIVSNEKQDFDEIEQIYEIDGELVYKKYAKRIGLEAIMPKYNSPSTKCIIHFRTLKVRDCMIVLDNKTIVSELFSGMFINPQYGTRGFIEFENEENDKNVEGKKNFDSVVIHIGNNKVRLSNDDIISFCEVIDSYGKKYIEAINNIEHLLKTKSFPLSKRENNYKLITLSNEVWYKLVKYAFNHDADNGNSDWHIFDRNWFSIKVFTNKEHAKYNIGYHAFFNSEYDEDIVFYEGLASKYKTITWEFVEPLVNRDSSHINKRESWDAEYAYKWLVEEYIPLVLGKKTSAKVLKKKNKDIDDILRNSQFNYFNYLGDNKIQSIDDLVNTVMLLQMHYYSKPNNKYRVSKEDLIGIYTSILLCINKSKRIDLHYICEKLSIYNCKTIKNLTKIIGIQIGNAYEKTLIGFDIDNLFRPLYVLLKDSKIDISYEDIKIIRKNIDTFITIYDREVLLEKYAINFI